MSSCVTKDSSSCATLRRDRRSSIHLKRNMNPYTGLWRVNSINMYDQLTNITNKSDEAYNKISDCNPMNIHRVIFQHLLNELFIIPLTWR